MIINNVFNNSIKEIPILSNELNAGLNTTNNSPKCLSVNFEPKQTLLNNKTIVQLQEIQDYTVLQISSKKEDNNFNGIPSLGWLKGRDDKLYNEKLQSLYGGAFLMNEFSIIVKRNQNSETISHKDWKVIASSIEGFKNGYDRLIKNRANTNDPIVHKVLDFIAPKTLQRIEVLKQYLSTKTKEPEILFELKDVDIKETTDIATINNSTCEKTDNLLDFLTKDLKWYKWYLEDQVDRATSYSLKLFHLSYSRQLEIRQVS
jgi:hypothetical protein